MLRLCILIIIIGIFGFRSSVLLYVFYFPLPVFLSVSLLMPSFQWYELFLVFLFICCVFGYFYAFIIYIVLLKSYKKNYLTFQSLFRLNILPLQLEVARKTCHHIGTFSSPIHVVVVLCIPPMCIEKVIR
jgi:hypothetical protein